MVTFTYIISGVILLGLCIFVHELGHLLGGKMVGIKAKVFSIGYGKGFIKKKFGDTTYQLTLIPFGGYCQFYGEDPSEERSGEGYEFLSAHPMKRIVTVAMGPLFNLFFGIMIFFVMNLVGYAKETNRIHIPEQLRSGKHVSAAYEAGIRSGDTIVRINEKEIKSFSDIQAAVIFSDGKKLDVTFSRENKKITKNVVPRTRAGSGRYEMGVMPYGTRVLVANVIDGSPAMKGGLKVMDEIISVDGKEIKSGNDFVTYINNRAGKEVAFSIQRKGSKIEKKIMPKMSEVIKIQIIDEKGKKGDLLTYNRTESFLKQIKKGEVSVNKKQVASYDALVQVIDNSKNRDLTFTIKDAEFSGTAQVDRVGLIGIMHTVAPDKVFIQYGFGGAFIQSFVEPYEFIVMNLKGMGMLIAGKMNVRQNLSGPIRIAKIAGDVVYYKGIPDFILLMAKISIILMVMNLLPIPVVDGSHIIFYVIEAIRGKPISQKIMERIQTVGVIMLIMLGVFIIINDITMLPVIQRLFN